MEKLILFEGRNDLCPDLNWRVLNNRFSSIFIEHIDDKQIRIYGTNYRVRNPLSLSSIEFERMVAHV